MMEKKAIEFKPSNLDLLLAVIASIGMPLLCGFLYDFTGSFIPILIYYVIFCIGVVKWRKKSFEYHLPQNWDWKIFIALLAIQIITQILALIIIIPAASFDAIGFYLTLFIWAPVNSIMEQLIWIYVYDAFARRFPGTPRKNLFVVLGILLSIILVGLIHAFFWGKFLPGFNHIAPFYQIFFVLQLIITPGYILLYTRTRSILPIALIHIISDVALVIGAGYSILPSLFIF